MGADNRSVHKTWMSSDIERRVHVEQVGNAGCVQFGDVAVHAYNGIVLRASERNSVPEAIGKVHTNRTLGKSIAGVECRTHSAVEKFEDVKRGVFGGVCKNPGGRRGPEAQLHAPSIRGAVWGALHVPVPVQREYLGRRTRSHLHCTSTVDLHGVSIDGYLANAPLESGRSRHKVIRSLAISADHGLSKGRELPRLPKGPECPCGGGAVNVDSGNVSVARDDDGVPVSIRDKVIECQGSVTASQIEEEREFPGVDISGQPHVGEALVDKQHPRLGQRAKCDRQGRFWPLEACVEVDVRLARKGEGGAVGTSGAHMGEHCFREGGQGLAADNDVLDASRESRNVVAAKRNKADVDIVGVGPSAVCDRL
eukprot:Opistho-2@14247